MSIMLLIYINGMMVKNIDRFVIRNNPGSIFYVQLTENKTQLLWTT